MKSGHQLSTPEKPASQAQNESGGFSRRARLGWLAVLFGVQLLYFPINRTVSGGAALVTPFDQAIPTIPIWAVPYLLGLVWWTAMFTWAALKMEALRYRALIAAMLFALVTSYAVYILFPTYVIRPEIETTGWSSSLLRWVYASDQLHNAFPSGHTYTTLIVVLFWMGWQPKLWALWISIAATVLLSTLFTGQHHILDLAGGAVWAAVGTRFGWWWTRREVQEAAR